MSPETGRPSSPIHPSDWDTSSPLLPCDRPLETSTGRWRDLPLPGLIKGVLHSFESVWEAAIYMAHSITELLYLPCQLAIPPAGIVVANFANSNRSDNIVGTNNGSATLGVYLGLDK